MSQRTRIAARRFAKETPPPQFVVITTDYATREVLAVYGPMNHVSAGIMLKTLPASSTKDHSAYALKQDATLNAR